MRELHASTDLLKALQGFAQNAPSSDLTTLNHFVRSFAKPTDRPNQDEVRFYWWVPTKNNRAAEPLQLDGEDAGLAASHVREIEDLVRKAGAGGRPAAEIIGTHTPTCLIGLSVQHSLEDTGGEGVLMAFRVDDFIEKALAPLTQSRINFTVYGANGETLYNRNSSRSGWYAILSRPFQPSPENWRREWPLHVADMRWRIVATPAEGYFGWGDVLTRLARFLVGLLIASLVSRILGTAQRSLLRSEERFRKAYANAAVGMIICDETSRILVVNEAICRLSGYREAELVGNSILEMIAPDDRQDSRNRIDLLIAGAVPSYQVEQRISQKDGSARWLRLSISGFEGQENQTALAILCEDISEQMSARETLIHQATHDLLTGLPNRRAFEANVTASIRQARSSSKPMALAYIDIDGFKVINDSLGHSTGDRLLVRLAERLARFVPQGAMLAHVGGDEFAVILKEPDEPDVVIARVDRMIRALENPFVFDSQELFISASAGISFYPWDGSDTDSLMQHADQAMYQAKRNGKRRCCVLTQEMRDAAAARLELETNLRRAVDRAEIEVHFQPIFDSRKDVVVRFEALCRWSYPSLGYVPPNRFIPIAEETGLIIPLGDFVLTTACRHAKLWNRRQTSSSIRVAINISPVQFSRADFVTKVTRALDETGLAPHLLQLELTESISLGDVDAAIRKMLQLRGLGISIAMDDFGTGYSSLNYLRRLPIDTLKIDRAFVQDIVSDPTSRNLVGSVISLAHGLGLRVVGEGVETTRQLDVLNSLACDELQGFLLGRPVDPEQAMELVMSGIPSHLDRNLVEVR